MRTACNGRICQTRISMQSADQKPDYHLEWPKLAVSLSERHEHKPNLLCPLDLLSPFSALSLRPGACHEMSLFWWNSWTSLFVSSPRAEPWACGGVDGVHGPTTFRPTDSASLLTTHRCFLGDFGKLVRAHFTALPNDREEVVCWIHRSFEEVFWRHEVFSIEDALSLEIPLSVSLSSVP